MAIIDSWEMLEKVVDAAGVDPKLWKSAHNEHLESHFGTFAFCWLVWEGVIDPEDIGCIAREISYQDQLVEKGHSRSYVPQRTNIMRKWLDQGIDEKEIAAVARDYQLDAIFNVLQTLEQGHFKVGDSELIFELRALLSDQEGSGVEIGDLIVDLFMSAKPKSRADTSQYV